MSQSVLDGLTLSYQLVWGVERDIVCVQLTVTTHADAGLSVVDARHLLSAWEDAGALQAPQILLKVDSEPLLRGLLALPNLAALWLQVDAHRLTDPGFRSACAQARQNGIRLVWRGAPGERASAGDATHFSRSMVTLSPEDALAALRISMRRHHGGVLNPNAAAHVAGLGLVQAGQIVESVPSRALLVHCLDEQMAWGLMGWPLEDVLHGYRHARIQPSHQGLAHLIGLIDADESLEALEHGLAAEPILAYRFLRFVNSVGNAVGNPIESIRHGLMVLGTSQLRVWLQSQLPQASSDLNLLPIARSAALRATLMANLLDAGDSDELRSEVYLCGLLAQIDLWVGEPLPVALHAMALSDRVLQAVLNQTGPYAPYMALAAALEQGHASQIEQLCLAQGLSLEHVNRALLRTLASAKPRGPRRRLKG